MKKKIFGLAMMAMTLIALPSMAQKPADKDSKQKTEQCCKKDGKKDCQAEGKRECKKGDKQKCKKGMSPDGRKFGKAGKKNPFEGMNLTEAQQAQLKDLQAKRMEKRQAEKAAVKAEKERRDSVKGAAKRAEKLEYFREIKEIVGPDNYEIFLENVAVSQAPSHQKGMKADKGGKKEGKFQKGQRPQGEGRPDKALKSVERN